MVVMTKKRKKNSGSTVYVNMYIRIMKKLTIQMIKKMILLVWKCGL